MIEFLKDVAIDFALFSGIEGLIFCLFFIKVGNYRKFTFAEWLILSAGNCIINQALPPVIYQIVMILWMSMFLFFISGKEKYGRSLGYSSAAMGMFFLLEILYSIILQKVLDLELLKFFMNDLESLKLFIFIIPLRIIEIINVFVIRRIKMKVVLGGVVRK